MRIYKSRLPDKDKLIKLYWEDFLTLGEIGNRYGCTVQTVSGRFIKFGIPRRRWKHGTAEIPEDELRALYCEKKESIHRISVVYGCSASFVAMMLEKYNIPVSRRRVGKFHFNWNGGIGWIGNNGYRVVTDPDTGGHNYEHRVVMERHLGRKLLREEHVHHLNGKKLDNRIENLSVMGAKEHFAITRNGRMKDFRELKTDNKNLRTQINKLESKIHRLLCVIEKMKETR